MRIYRHFTTQTFILVLIFTEVWCSTKCYEEKAIAVQIALPPFIWSSGIRVDTTYIRSSSSAGAEVMKLGISSAFDMY